MVLNYRKELVAGEVCKKVVVDKCLPSHSYIGAKILDIDAEIR